LRRPLSSVEKKNDAAPCGALRLRLRNIATYFLKENTLAKIFLMCFLATIRTFGNYQKTAYPFAPFSSFSKKSRKSPPPSTSFSLTGKMFYSRKGTSFGLKDWGPGGICLKASSDVFFRNQ
jgi:hypothetical protein